MSEDVPQFELSDRLRKARQKAGLDQDYLARCIGVSRALVSRWEHGLSEPRVSHVTIWAKETNVRLDWLMRGDNASRPVSRRRLSARKPKLVALG